MKKAQHDHFMKELQTAQDQFDQTISELGEEIRKQVIIPVCKRNKLEFISGMGRFFFTTNLGKDIGDASEAEGTRLERVLKPIFDLLNEEVSHNQYLGYFVSDVRKDDLK